MASSIFSNYINGAWVEGASSIVNRSPADTEDVVGRYAQADADQVDRAIAAAAAQPAWARSGLEERWRVLMAIGDELIARKAELGEQLSREEGKTLAEGVGEVHRSGQFFHYYAAEVLRQLGETADSVRPGVEIEVRREPVGVVAIITPWNFPMATAAWKIAPALAFGNAVVFKPANAVPASAWALTEIIARQPARRRLQPGHGQRRRGRGAADPVGGDPGAELHGLGRDRPPGRGRDGRQFRALPTGNGQQERPGGAGRRRSAPGGGMRGEWRVLRHRAEVHRLIPTDRDRGHTTATCRRWWNASGS